MVNYSNVGEICDVIQFVLGWPMGLYIYGENAYFNVEKVM